MNLSVRVGRMGWGDVQADASAQYSIRAHRAERGRCDCALLDGCSKAAPHGHSTAVRPHDVSGWAKLKGQALAARRHQEGRARGSLRRGCIMMTDRLRTMRKRALEKQYLFPA